MSSEVTYSPTSGATTVRPAAASAGATPPHSTNSSSCLVEPSPFSTAVTRVPRVGRRLVQQPPDQQGGECGRRHQRPVLDPRLAVDAEPECHLAVRHLEQRLVRAGQGAAAERDAERAGAVVRAARDALDRVEIVSRLGRGAPRS